MNDQAPSQEKCLLQSWQLVRWEGLRKKGVEEGGGKVKTCPSYMWYCFSIGGCSWQVQWGGISQGRCERGREGGREGGRERDRQTERERERERELRVSFLPSTGQDIMICVQLLVSTPLPTTSTWYGGSASSVLDTGLCAAAKDYQDETQESKRKNDISELTCYMCFCFLVSVESRRSHQPTKLPLLFLITIYSDAGGLWCIRH